ncbi:TetR/AcrR family transcriptional regulator [Salinibacterium sp. SWN248]|uniref:TetR/AcrR family transcriptional regulator n=1 Tax=Salinibacterium sp. SWN248 TaxID=2792056 RepID=UPI0018CCC406|nr:TetR/AcrR family transcriptional regulator [Salinibacterium sp. SWN248]MBH0023524.1 TetR/AcrR family transcriptional regulator [Salinibacterium sp. SWN248]
MSASTTVTSILEATRALVLELGYASLSTRKVAARARVPLSQIHYHFGSKEQLVLRMLDAENEQLLERQSALYAADEPLSQQWATACDYLEEDLNSGYVRILHEMLAAGLSSAVVGERVRSMIQGWSLVLTEAATRHAARGFSFAPLTIEQVVALTCAAFIGAELLILAGHEKELPLREALRAIGAVIEAGEHHTAQGADS